MTYLPRLLVTAFAALAAANLLAALFAAASWRIRARMANAASPALQAAALVRLRSIPLAAALVFVMLAVSSFLTFEPNVAERVGSVVFRLLALGGALLTIASAWRLWRTARHTRRVVGRWMASARPVSLPGWTLRADAIDSSFPVVAVVGVFRPRLVIASCVLAACSADELAAVLGHERSHVRRRDNLRRLLFAAAPDLVSWLPIGSRFAHAWHTAAEAAADDAAVGHSGAARLALADGLVRVARLAAGQPAIELPASALYRGEDLANRVRRLVAGPAQSAARSHFAPWLLGAAVVTLVTAGLSNMHAVHELIELAIKRLP